MAFSYKAVHLSENPCYTLSRSGLIESPYIQTTRTRFVQPGKIEIDANERAAIGKRNAAFSFAPSSILSLTICENDQMIRTEIRYFLSTIQKYQTKHAKTHGFPWVFRFFTATNRLPAATAYRNEVRSGLFHLAIGSNSGIESMTCCRCIAFFFLLA